MEDNKKVLVNPFDEHLLKNGETQCICGTINAIGRGCRYIACPVEKERQRAIKARESTKQE